MTIWFAIAMSSGASGGRSRTTLWLPASLSDLRTMHGRAPGGLRDRRRPRACPTTDERSARRGSVWACDNWRMRSLAAFVAALCLIATPVFAGDTTKLRIEVKNHYDKPVDRASVVVKFVEGRSIAKLGKKIIKNWELRTNQEGIARVPLELPQGKIQIQVIAKGYQTYGEIFNVNEEEKTIAIKLNPPQPQHSEHQ